MKTKTLLAVVGVLYVLSGISEFFLVPGFEFTTYSDAVGTLSLGVLFWLMRNVPPSKALNGVLIVGFLATFGWSLVALYSQWNGTFMDSAVGYIPGLIWMGLAVWFFLAWRGNKSAA